MLPATSMRVVYEQVAKKDIWKLLVHARENPCLYEPEEVAHLVEMRDVYEREQRSDAMLEIPCDKIGEIATAAREAHTAGVPVDTIVAIVRSLVDPHVRAEAERYLRRDVPIDGIARGVRPTHASKRAVNGRAA